MITKEFFGNMSIKAVWNYIDKLQKENKRLEKAIEGKARLEKDMGEYLTNVPPWIETTDKEIFGH